MSVLELSELLKDFEEKFGVTAAAPVAVAAAAARRWWRGRRRRGREGRVRRHPGRRRREEDRRHQGRPPGRLRPGPQGGQGPRRRRPQAGAREGQQGRGREGQGRPRGGRRHRRAQVALTGTPVRPEPGAIGHPAPVALGADSAVVRLRSFHADRRRPVAGAGRLLRAPRSTATSAPLMSAVVLLVALLVADGARMTFRHARQHRDVVDADACDAAAALLTLLALLVIGFATVHYTIGPPARRPVRRARHQDRRALLHHHGGLHRGVRRHHRHRPGRPGDRDRSRCSSTCVPRRRRPGARAGPCGAARGRIRSPIP